jgi:ABC-type branched-subunit amino acid transport system substrate-binding protein
MKRKKMTGKLTWRFIAGFATVLAWAASAAAQTVVVGTGDPDTDVKAVQAAVDQGGEVTLKGHFSFNRAPTVPTATAFVGVEGSRDLWHAE